MVRVLSCELHTGDILIEDVGQTESGRSHGIEIVNGGGEGG